MESNARTEASNPIALSRMAGLCAVGYVLTALLGLSGALGGNLYFSDVPASDVLAWIGQNGQLISLSIFLTGLATTLLYGGLIVLLVQLTAALAIGGSSVLALRAGVLPPWSTWYGMIVAAFFVIADAFRIFGLGLVGPLGVLLAFAWILIVGLTLLARPVRASRASNLVAVAAAC